MKKGTHTAGVQRQYTGTAAEQRPVQRGPVLAQVLPEQAGQDQRDGERPRRDVLEAARFMRRTGAGQRGAGARAGAGEDQLAPPVRRQDEIGAVQCVEQPDHLAVGVAGIALR